MLLVQNMFILSRTVKTIFMQGQYNRMTPSKRGEISFYNMNTSFVLRYYFNHLVNKALCVNYDLSRFHISNQFP